MELKHLPPVIIFLFLGLVNPVPAQNSTSTRQNDSLLLTHLTVIDVVKLNSLPDHHLLIRDGRIAAVYTSKNLPKDYNGVVMDLTGCTVIPALIDAHCHLTKDTIQSLENALRKGITTVRDMSGDGELLKSLQSDIREGRMPGPDIYFSAVMGGHAFMQKDLRVKLCTPERYELGQAPWMREVSDLQAIPGVIGDAVRFGVTGIKMYADLTSDQVKNLSTEAHRQGLRVWSHSFVGPATADDVIAAHADVISHAPGLMYPVNWSLTEHGSLYMDRQMMVTGELDRRLEAMKKAGVMLDPTLTIFEEKLGRLGETEEVSNYRESITALMHAVHEHRIAITAGTDLELPRMQGEYPALYRELELLETYSGMTPIECLQAATLNGAIALGIESEKGSITPGKIADLIILNKNPALNISNIRDIRFTIQQGKIYEPALEKGHTP